MSLGLGRIAAVAVPDKAAVLQRLRSSPFPRKEATLVAKSDPRTASELCLDLIFSRWCSIEFGGSAEVLDGDISGIGQIIQGLASASTPAVEWARAVLTQPGIDLGKTRQVDQRGEKVDQLAAAKKNISQAVRYRQSSPVRAASEIDKAASVCEKLGLDLSRAAILRERGDLRVVMGQYRLAEQDYEQAWMIYANYKCDGRYAEVREALGLLNMQLSRFSEADRNFLDAANRWAAKGQGHKACRQFINAGKARAALGRQEEASSAMWIGRNEGVRWAIAHKSYRMLVEDLLEYGRFLSECEDRAGARDVLFDADKWARQSGDAKLRSRVLAELGPAWAAAGNNQKAEECAAARKNLLLLAAQPGIAVARKVASGGSFTVAERNKAVSDLSTGGWALFELKDYRKAAWLYEQAAVLYSKMGKGVDEALALMGAAKAYEAAGDVTKASPLRLRAADTAEAAGANALAAQLLVEFADAQASADPSAALSALAEAARNAQNNRQEYAAIQRARAKLLADQEQYAEAILHLDNAARSYIAEVGEPWTYAAMSSELAELYRAIGQTEKEIDSLARAIERAEAWLEYEGFEPTDEPEYAGRLASMYSRLLPLEVKMGKLTEATDHLRKASSHGWFEVMSKEILANGGDGAKKFLDEFQTVATPPISPTGGKGLIAEGWPDVLQISWQLAQSYPRFSSQVVIDITRIFKYRERLPEGMLIVEYLIGGNVNYAFVLGEKTAYCRQLELQASQIDVQMRTLRACLARDEERSLSGIPVPPVKDWRDAHVREIIESLEQLEKLLVAPIREELKGASTVAFAPPQELMGVPFHAFARPEGDSIRFLIEDFAICYVTRMTFDDLVGPERPIQAGSSKAVVFANPLGDLEGAEFEAEAIKQAFPDCEVYAGPKATPEQFRKSLATAAVLHIAAHHKSNDSAGGFSIELAGGSGRDSLIDVSDLCDVKNEKLGLVVLSACETAGSTNPTQKGIAQAAEVISLTGAPTVIGALWKVSDKGTSVLMGEMYRRLARGVPKSEALRQAQISMIASRVYAHPYYWAGFALFGNPK